MFIRDIPGGGRARRCQPSTHALPELFADNVGCTLQLAECKRFGDGIESDGWLGKASLLEAQSNRHDRAGPVIHVFGHDVQWMAFILAPSAFLPTLPTAHS